ncbi:MAG: glycosyltransferase family 2 protein [Chitinophagaceae bacterium]|nr:glycosyltransferase family 2 protein [Chitinophagaceae bacterium]
MPKLSIIIPCYYNELNIPVTTQKLLANELVFSSQLEFEYIFIDDGSGDNTWQALLSFKQTQKANRVKLIKLSGNFGSYNAILAGMQHATGDCNVVISADLQDPPELILNMYEYWEKGVKLVIGNRTDRKDPFFSKLFSQIFQKLIKKFALKNLPNGGFDFVFFDKQLKNEVVRMNEKNTNTLYLFAWMKYPYVTIPYQRRERELGKSRWTFSKKLKLFIDSFVSFSFLPIRVITVLGFILGLISVLYSGLIIYSKITGGIQIQGWSALMIVLLLVSSFQMIALGVLGEYIWRTLDASRKRPNYIIDTVVD